MPFEIKGKVALVTGGASGIGLHYVKELLRNGLRGVTISDINADFGQKALEEIEKEFGPNKAIFVVTDVSNFNNFEDAFKKTIEQFKNIDILINNAGIFNDALWEKAIAININGTMHGILLGLENYLQKYKSGPEGVIVNIASVTGISPFPQIPVYSMTKFAVVGMSKAWGYDAHYQRTKIKVLCLCPGVTETPLIMETADRSLGPAYAKIQDDAVKLNVFPPQKPEHVGKAAMTVIENAKTGSVWVIEGGQEPYEYISTPREHFITNK